MAENQEQPQEKQQNALDEPSLDTSESNTQETEMPPVSRPRALPDNERLVQHEERRSFPQDIRDVTQLHSSASPECPLASSPITGKQQDKLILDEQEPEAARTDPKKGVMRVVEDREMVKWAAWGALLVSLVTSFLLGLYSSREFGPVFEYYDLEVTQKQIAKDVGRLKYSSQLEKIQNAIIHAQVQLFIRKDYEAAEAILENAKEDLKRLIDALPIEKTIEPKQILANIEHALAEVRLGPASLDRRLDQISKDLSKLKN